MRLDKEVNINEYLESIKNRPRRGIEWNINENNLIEEDILKVGFKRFGMIKAGQELFK